MDDLISRIKEWINSGNRGNCDYFIVDQIENLINEYEKALPPAQPQDKVLLDKEAILQAGYQGKEVEFHIGGRLFAIREKAQ